MSAIINLDVRVLDSINGFFVRHQNIFLEKLFAEYLIYLLPVILIVLWFYSRQSKKVALEAGFSVILAWPILAKLISLIVKRPRPIPVGGVQELLFHRPDFSFPSDHAAALFAVAFSLWFAGYKKLSYVMFAMAIVISFFRVATAIHYPLDIVGGLAVGFLAAYLIYLFRNSLDPVYNFIIKTAHYLKLA